MLSNISVQNIHSIEDAETALSPITVLYGPTSSGKSSLLYSLLVLRNFVLNPNQLADGFFHLGFMDLGGFDASVFNHDKTRSVSIVATQRKGNFTSSFGLSFSKSSGSIHLKMGSLPVAIPSPPSERVPSLDMLAQVSIPYGLNQTFAFMYTEDTEEFTVNWNGIGCTVVPKNPTAETQQRAGEITTMVNSSSELLKGIDIAPHRRGFFKPNYTPVAPSPTPTSEDEVASLIINDPNMAGRISVYIEEIFGRDFRLHVPIGTATAFLQTTEKKSKIPVYLVNDGFGVNQVVYLLAKMCRVDTHTILIEEPEIHLHPTVIRNFARTLCTFIKDEGKQVILTTHSELFLISLLTAVSEGIANPDDIKCYLTTKEKKTTIFKEQKVQENGQIAGGLSSFVEGELEDLIKFLRIK